MIAEGQESQRIDDIVDTVALVISGHSVARSQHKEPKSLQESKAKEKDNADKIEPSEKVQNEVKKVVEEEPEDPTDICLGQSKLNKANMELHNVLFQSKLESLVPIYDLNEETQLFSIRGMIN